MSRTATHSLEDAVEEFSRFEPIRCRREGLMPASSSSGARRARHRRGGPRRTRFGAARRRTMKYRCSH